MPAKSEKQRRAMAMALALKKGKISPKKVNSSVKHLADSMSKGQLEDFATKTASYSYAERRDDDVALKRYLDYLTKLGY